MDRNSEGTDLYTGKGPLPDTDTGSVTAEDYIAAIPMWTRRKNSLEDIREFLTALHVSGENIIHVAGTNGKGSVCAYLTSMLNAAHFTTGTFVSPHLSDVRERFLINGTPVEEADFSAAFGRVLAVVREKTAEGFAHPSYFEFCFLMAMTLFTEKDVDFRILETGLGGRLDATNSVKDALACVITSISLDHTQYLGDTIEEIAAEKAGIIKPGVPVIYDAGDVTAARIIEKVAGERHAKAYPVGVKDNPEELNHDRGESVTLPPGIEFPAPYQRVNASLAVRTLQVLGIPGVTQDAVYEGLSSFNWQARMEEIKPGIWLDGAHNPGGAKALAEAVKTTQKVRGPFGVHLLFAASDDKDYPAMIHLLCRELSPGHVTVTSFEGGRAADTSELGSLFVREGVRDVKITEDPADALASALSELESARKHADTGLFITGSLYLSGALRRCLI